MKSLLSTPKHRVHRWAALAACGVSMLAMVGCASQTVVEPAAQTGSYKVSVKLDPPTLNPPQVGTLTFGISDATTGKALSAFESTSGALLHSVIISRDLTNFYHSYTQELVDGQASVVATFPQYSRYFVYTIYKPAGAAVQSYSATVSTTGREGQDANLAPEFSRQNTKKTSGWLTFDLLKSQGDITAGQPTQLGFYITERGRPVSGLWPYLGAAGQAWIVDSKGENFAHEITMAASNVAAEGSPTAQSNSSQGTSSNGTPETVPGSAASGASGGTGGTGAGGTGQGGTRSGPPGTEEAMPTPNPSPTFSGDVANALATAQAEPTQLLSAVQETPQSGILTTPEVVPSVGYGPTLAITHTFPHAGLYKMWLEVYYRGQPIVVNYVLQVK